MGFASRTEAITKQIHVLGRPGALDYKDLIWYLPPGKLNENLKSTL